MKTFAKFIKGHPVFSIFIAIAIVAILLYIFVPINALCHTGDCTPRAEGNDCKKFCDKKSRIWLWTHKGECETSSFMNPIPCGGGSGKPAVDTSAM